MQSAQERGTARDRLLDALRANPNSTSAELAEKADIGRSTAGKILARLAGEGAVTRISGIATGGRRPADRWISGHDDTPAQTAPTADVDEPKPSAESAKTQRLAPGRLQEMILGHLRAHLGEEFGPSQLGKTRGLCWFLDR
jgi:hypothetical protein